MVGKVDIATQQIYKTIQNKIPLDKGIVRKSLEVDKGYVSALHNFEIKNGETLTVRPGTRVMNSMQDQQFYFVESFKMSNMNIVIGLNYKRELWAWLEKWPETDFKVCNTSPFKKYRHKDSGGNTFYSPHFSFTKGNKFFVGEDDFSIIIFNDFGEIFRLMKVGSIRITTDADTSDKYKSIKNARSAYLFTGRIWLDIKEATNRVFDNKMFIGDEYIRNSHRITGETRFAYVNELSVISELSDPVDIKGYRHVIASRFPFIPFDVRNKEVPFDRIVSTGATAAVNRTIYQGNETGIEVGAASGAVWERPNPFTVDETTAYGIALVVQEEGKYVDSLGNETVVPVGVYMCLTDAVGSFYELDPSQDFSFNIIELKFIDNLSSTNIGFKYFKPISVDCVEFPRVKKVFPEKKLVALENLKGVMYDETKVTIDTVNGKWIKLSDSIKKYVDKRKYPEYLVYLGDNSNEHIMIPNGYLYEVEMALASDSEFNLTWHESMIRGIELNSGLGTSSWAMFRNKGFDCWDMRGSLSSSTGEIDYINKVFVLDIDDGIDALLAVNEEDLYEYYKSETMRFALWNDSHIMGISQRDFKYLSTGSEGSDNPHDYSPWSETNENFRADSVNNELRVVSQPLMTLDYTGLRKIPMPLPLIRKAMRNPQFVVVAGSNVYSVEDNKIWVGSVSDCMMIDEIELHSAIYDVKAFGSGMIASTKNGLFLVERGSDVKRVINGDSVIPRFMAVCSGGVLVVEDNNIYVVHRKITSTGSWYPTLTQINEQIIEANFEGKLKSVSIGDIIYLADEYTVWLYDIKKGIWCGQYIYGENGEKIQNLFVFNSKLGVVFETGIDREKSFDAPGSDIK